MRYKRVIIAILFLIGFTTRAIAVEKWNVAVGNWNNLTRQVNNTPLIIKKSINSYLQNQPKMNSFRTTNASEYITNSTSALEMGKQYKADFVVYGDIFLEGSMLIVVVELYDVLNDRLKMRKLYSTEYSLDMFEALDKIMNDSVTQIQKVFSKIDYEEQARVSGKRAELYDKKNELDINRAIYMHFGMNYSINPGYRNRAYYYDSNSIAYNEDESMLPNLKLSWGFTARYDSWKADLLISGFPGVSSYEMDHGSFMPLDVNSSMVLNVFWYIPALREKLAVGLGIFTMEHFMEIRSNYNFDAIEFDAKGVFGWNIALIYAPIPEIELGVSVQMPPYFVPRLDYDTNSNNRNDWKEYEMIVPNIGFNAQFMFGESFGMQARMMYQHVHITAGRYNDFGVIEPNETTEAYNEVWQFYLGIVYKVDLMNTQ